MKSFERIMVRKVRDEVQDLLDPYQFAYRYGRVTNDALNTKSSCFKTFEK